MENTLNQLDLMIISLKKTNDLIFESVDDNEIKKLEEDRNDIISIINEECKNIKSKLPEKYYQMFNYFIKKYLSIQKDYYDRQKNMFIMELMIKNSNITNEMANDIVINGCRTKNVSCLVSENEIYNYVKHQHKNIIQLEKCLHGMNQFMHM